MIKHLLEQMTQPEFRARIAEDPVIILPFGSTEVQGPCNPMGDFMLAGALAARVAERTGAIAAPVMPFGYADTFRDVPGGIQVSADTFRGLARDVVGAFLDHGLNRLLVFNGHTGNSALIDEVLRSIRRTRHVIVPWLNIWPMVPAALRSKAHGPNAGRASGHGSDPIGSVYEHLFPALTRRDVGGEQEKDRSILGLPTAGLTGVRFGDVHVNAPVRITDHCDLVVSGDPSLANAEAGRLFCDYIIETASALVEHLKTAPQQT